MNKRSKNFGWIQEPVLCWGTGYLKPDGTIGANTEIGAGGGVRLKYPTKISQEKEAYEYSLLETRSGKRERVLNKDGFYITYTLEYWRVMPVEELETTLIPDRFWFQNLLDIEKRYFSSGGSLRLNFYPGGRPEYFVQVYFPEPIGFNHFHDKLGHGYSGGFSLSTTYPVWEDMTLWIDKSLEFKWEPRYFVFNRVAYGNMGIGSFYNENIPVTELLWLDCRNNIDGNWWRDNSPAAHVVNNDTSDSQLRVDHMNNTDWAMRGAARSGSKFFASIDATNCNDLEMSAEGITLMFCLCWTPEPSYQLHAPQFGRMKEDDWEHATCTEGYGLMAKQTGGFYGFLGFDTTQAALNMGSALTDGSYYSGFMAWNRTSGDWNIRRYIWNASVWVFDATVTGNATGTYIDATARDLVLQHRAWNGNWHVGYYEHAAIYDYPFIDETSYTNVLNKVNVQ